MKYVLIDDCQTDIYTEEFNDLEAAIKEGNNQFERLTKTDLKRRKAFFLLETVNPDPEAENHFDGDIIKTWKEG